MKEKIEKIFCLDGDLLTITFLYDEHTNRYYGEYPDFYEEPRFTPNGRPWVNVTNEECPHCEGEYGDCGSCPYLSKKNPKDLIGICMNEKLNERVNQGDYHQKRKEEI